MSAAQLWTRAATAMREDADPRWHAVGDWLRAEAVLRDELEPVTEVFNMAIEQQSGVKGYIRFARKPNGELDLRCDTDEAATAVALAYLGEQ